MIANSMRAVDWIPWLVNSVRGAAAAAGSPESVSIEHDVTCLTRPA